MSLKHVESIMDRMEARNLCMAFAHFQKGTPEIEEKTLYFENVNKCKHVKDSLDRYKKEIKQRSF